MSLESAARLTALLDALRALPPFPALPQPSAEPSGGVDDWLAEVARARASANQHALAHRANIDLINTQLFGQTHSDLLPPIEVELQRSTLSVAVPHDPQLRELYGVDAARGPGARGPASTEVQIMVTSPPAPSAAIVRLHGGAFWMGGDLAAENIDTTMIDQLAARTNAIVLNVDYRLAPEHPFPATIVDALCVVDALRDGLLDIPADRIALMGTSSGANVAVAAAMADAARAPKAPLAALALIVPSVLIAEVPAVIRDDPAAWATRQSQLRSYLGSSLDTADPWVSPAVLPSIPGMPPTFAVIARHDEIAVGGHQLARAIEAGGGSATARDYEMTHTVAPPEVEAALIDDTVEFLRANLG